MSHLTEYSYLLLQGRLRGKHTKQDLEAVLMDWRSLHVKVDVLRSVLSEILQDHPDDCGCGACYALRNTECHDLSEDDGDELASTVGTQK